MDAMRNQDRVDASPYRATFRAPFAALGIRTDGARVTGIDYLPTMTREQVPADRVAEQLVRELARYLDDPAAPFTVPLAPQGTAFRQRVWAAIQGIPVGESRTYGELARRLHTAPRAVGGACGANDIALVVPCHRVVGSQGSLGGFMHAIAGDPLAIKRWLLTHEGYRFGA